MLPALLTLTLPLRELPANTAPAARPQVLPGHVERFLSKDWTYFILVTFSLPFNIKAFIMLGESRCLKWFELAAGQAEKADKGPAVTGRAADKLVRHREPGPENGLRATKDSARFSPIYTSSKAILTSQICCSHYFVYWTSAVWPVRAVPHTYG